MEDSVPELQTSIKPRANLLVVVDVDNSPLPLASWDMAIEQDVDFAEGSTLHFWYVEVRQDEADETSRGPDVAAPAAQVDALLR